MKKFSLEKMSKWWLFLYVPIYAVLFTSVELLIPNTVDYFVSYVPLDDAIPFTSWFVTFYVTWYAYMLVPGLYLLFKDEKAFKRYMYFIIVGFTCCIIFFAIFPNGQNLRPNVEDIDNGFFSSIVKLLYSSDTNTNVLPSMHVLGSMGVIFACFNSSKLNKKRITIPMTILGFLICVSTVCIKQHSLIDGIAGVAFSIVIYLITYGKLLNKDNTITNKQRLFSNIMRISMLVILLVSTFLYCICKVDNERIILLFIGILSFIILLCLYTKQNKTKINDYLMISFTSLSVIYCLLDIFKLHSIVSSIIYGILIGCTCFLVINTIINKENSKNKLSNELVIISSAIFGLALILAGILFEYFIDKISGSNMLLYISNSGLFYVGMDTFSYIMREAFLNIVGIVLVIIALVSYDLFKKSKNLN